jgi:hypothetical protein
MNRPRPRAHFAVSLAVALAALPAGAQDKPARPPTPPAAPLPSPAPPAAAAPPADAAPVDEATAKLRALKASADRSMDGLRFADAYAGYSDIYAVTHDASLLYNMGRALQALNRFPEALTRLETFQAVASPELKKRVPRLDELVIEVRKRVATLTVKSDVPGARVLVRSTVMSRLPLGEPLRLSSGKAEIDVEAEGYFPYHTVVELPGGGELTVQARLFSRATTGLLAVNASANGSEVFVDGKSVGTAPVELNVPSGNHPILVKNPDFRDYRTTAAVPAGSRKEVVARLLPPSVVTRWWFWGSVALALATAGAITAAALIERPADRGDIAPGQLPAPGGQAAAVRGAPPQRAPVAAGVTILSF